MINRYLPNMQKQTISFKAVRLCTLLILLLTSPMIHAQLNFQLNGNDVQSKFIEDWQRNKTVELSCTNSSSDSNIVSFRSSLWWNDSILCAYSHDSIGRPFQDTLFPGTNYFYLNSLLPISSTYLVDSFATSYELNGELMEGDFKVYVSVVRNDSIIFTDSLEFAVDPYMAPGLEAPYDNCNIYRNGTPSVAFTWYPVSPTPTNSVVYHFKLFEFPIDSSTWEQVHFIELDSNSDSDTAFYDFNPVWFDESLPLSQNIEKMAKTAPSVYEAQVTDMTELYLPSHICELLYNNYTGGKTRYGWSVTSFDASTGLEIGSNEGMSYPFVFNLTNQASDTIYILNKSGNYCASDGFELGRADGWRFWKGKVNPIFFGLARSIKWDNEGKVTGYHEVLPYQPDALLGTTLYTTTSSSNLYSLRVGNTTVGGYASRVIHSFTVDANMTSLLLSYAMILGESDHIRSIDPFYEIKIYRNGYASFPFFKEKKNVKNTGTLLPSPGPGSYLYTPWDCYEIDLSERIGQTITIEIVTADCAEGGHLGYGYVDFCAITFVTTSFTTNKTVYCLTDDVIANGSNTEGETRHEWIIEKCDQNGIVIPGTTHRREFSGIAGQFDVRAFYEERGETFSCNSYYKVSLKAWNGCNMGPVFSKVIQFSCPPDGQAGPNYCCPNKSCSPITLGPSSAVSGLTYSWAPINGACATCITNTSTANPTYNVATSSSIYQDDYLLTVTDPNGCSSTDVATIYFQAPTIGQIDTTPVECGVTFSVSATAAHIIEWWVSRDGGPLEFYGYADEITVSKQSSDPNAFDVYWVRATNACGTSAWQRDTVFPGTSMYGMMSDITYVNTFSYGASQEINRRFTIFDYNKDLGEPNSYNVKEWELWIMDRNGAIWKVNSGSRVAGTTKNGDIYWDGRINGKYVPAGKYTWFLKYTNCQYTNMNYHQANHIEVQEHCNKVKKNWDFRRFIGLKWCDEWEWLSLMNHQTYGDVYVYP